LTRPTCPIPGRFLAALRGPRPVYGEMAGFRSQLDQNGDLMREIRICGLAAILSGALAAAACSDGALGSPSGPSPLNAAPETTAATPVIDRSTVVGSAAADWAVNSGWNVTAEGQMVEGSAVITAVDGACPNLVITVRGVPVTINSGTMFGS